MAKETIQINAPSQEPLGWVELDAPISLDVQALCYIMYGEHLTIEDGSEYILDGSGTTIILFAGKTSDGFTKIYSPINAHALKAALAMLPDDKRLQIERAYGIEALPETSIQPLAPTDFPWVALGIQQATFTTQPHAPAAFESSSTPPPTSLPENHFLELDRTAMERKKAMQWTAVENLDDNDPRKILYFRRFFSEYRGPVSFNPKLTEQSETNFRYYGVDTSKKVELPDVTPYQTTLKIPAGLKVGIVIGYHHLEKPWGKLFKEMFLRQVNFPPEQIEFVEIENRNIPTGDNSPQSESEIVAAVAQQRLTHVIDVHEQLSTSNHYMDLHGEDPKFKTNRPKKTNCSEYTLDPFVPLWAIEQYYEGNIYPTLQHAVNEQIRVVERLVQSLAT